MSSLAEIQICKFNSSQQRHTPKCRISTVGKSDPWKTRESNCQFCCTMAKPLI